MAAEYTQGSTAVILKGLQQTIASTNDLQKIIIESAATHAIDDAMQDSAIDKIIMNIRDNIASLDDRVQQTRNLKEALGQRHADLEKTAIPFIEERKKLKIAAKNLKEIKNTTFQETDKEKDKIKNKKKFAELNSQVEKLTKQLATLITAEKSILFELEKFQRVTAPKIEGVRSVTTPPTPSPGSS